MVALQGRGAGGQQALSNKQIDFAYQGDLPQVVGRANGLKTKLVASGVRNNLYLVAPVASPLSSIKDIRDHKVSIFRGTNGHLVAIKRAGRPRPVRARHQGRQPGRGQRPGRAGVQRVDAAFGGYEWFRCATRPGKVIYSTGQDPAYARPRCWCARSSSATTRRRCRRW